MESKQKTCAERVEDHWNSRRADLELFAEYRFADLGDLDEREVDPDDWDKMCDLGGFLDYGLCFDYVEPGTFKGQLAGYYRYQFSWGGPSDELRFYGNGDVTYWFLDWNDGASLDVTSEPVVQELVRYLLDCEMMPKFEGIL